MDTRICTRCSKEFDINTLSPGLVKRNLFSKCSDCRSDLERRGRIKKSILRKLPNERSKEDLEFLKDHKNIKTKIPDDLPSRFNMNAYHHKVDSDLKELECITCKKIKSVKEFSTKIKKGVKVYVKSCNRCNKISSRKSQFKVHLREGFLYIIQNKAWKGYYKIGKAVNIKNRLVSYNTATPFNDFEVLYKIKVKRPGIYEQEIIDEYGEYLAEGQTEWYKLTKKKLEEIMHYLDTKDENVIYEEWLNDVSNLDELDDI
jgi:NAD-dependent SIR2 family protein deacetylase